MSKKLKKTNKTILDKVEDYLKDEKFKARRNFVIKYLFLFWLIIIGTVITIKYIIPEFASRDWIFEESEIGAKGVQVKNVIEKTEEIIVDENDRMAMTITNLEPSLARLFSMDEEDDLILQINSIKSYLGVIVTEDGVLAFPGDIDLSNKIFKIEFDEKVIEIAKKDLWKDPLTGIYLVKIDEEGLKSISFTESSKDVKNKIVPGQIIHTLYSPDYSCKYRIDDVTLKDVNYLVKSNNLLSTDSYSQYYSIDSIEQKSVVVDRLGRLVGFSIDEEKGTVLRAEDIENVVERFIDTEELAENKLGITYQSICENTKEILELDKSGLLVTSVEQGSIMDQFGVKKGDLIIEIDGKDLDEGVFTNEMFEKYVKVDNGGKVKLLKEVVTVVRGDEELKLHVD